MPKVLWAHEPYILGRLEHPAFARLLTALLGQLLAKLPRITTRVVRVPFAVAVHLTNAHLAKRHSAREADAVGGAGAGVAEDAHGEWVDRLDAPRLLLRVHQPCRLRGAQRTPVAGKLLGRVEGVVVAPAGVVDEDVVGLLELEEVRALLATVPVRVVQQSQPTVRLLDVVSRRRRLERERLIEVELETAKG